MARPKHILTVVALKHIIRYNYKSNSPATCISTEPYESDSGFGLHGIDGCVSSMIDWIAWSL